MALAAAGRQLLRRLTWPLETELIAQARIHSDAQFLRTNSLHWCLSLLLARSPRGSTLSHFGLSVEQRTSTTLYRVTCEFERALRRNNRHFERRAGAIERELGREQTATRDLATSERGLIGEKSGEQLSKSEHKQRG